MKKIYMLFLAIIVIKSSMVSAQNDMFQNVLRANRRVNAKIVRSSATNQQASRPLGVQLSNCDEQRFADKRGSFSKSLKTQDNGLVHLPAFNQMVFALHTGNPCDFNNITMGTWPVERKLANPQAAFAFNLDGPDGWIHTMPAAPSICSAETAGEMVELYWHALLRDVFFNHYDTDAGAAVADLNNLSNFKGPKVNGLVTAGTLFRGNTPGDLIGPLVSQFLYLPVPYGPDQNFDGGPGGTPGIDFQAQIVPISSTINDFVTTFTEWLSIQRGNDPATSIIYTDTRIFIRNARDLGSYVHKDHPMQSYVNAALILLYFGADALDKNNPYINNPTQGAFTTYGTPDIIYLVSVVTEIVLRAAWYQKWLVHRRARPEYYGFLVNQQITGAQNFCLHSDVINSAAVSVISWEYGFYFLPLAYPEGSPTHPSYPAGHAVVAGAATTILKAFFNEAFVFPESLQPDDTNTILEPYAGTPLTVGNELNKLASNIALGRDYAGVHYRSDGTEGILLGEKIAISFLEDEAFTRNIPFKGFSLTKFNGKKITVGAKKYVKQLRCCCS
ncbi:vanadium-dependent haloperoxidase [Candidatus Dependentiae bacterium]